LNNVLRHATIELLIIPIVSNAPELTKYNGAISIDVEDPSEHGTSGRCEDASMMRAHLAGAYDDDPSGEGHCR